MALVAMLAAGGAQAQTFQLNSAENLTVGNFTLAFSSCTYKYNNAVQASCAADNLDVDVSVSGKTLTLTYLNATTPSAALLSQASAEGCTCVYYDLTVTSTLPISKAAAYMTGVNNGGSGATLNNQAQLIDISGTPSAQAALIAPTSATSASGTYSLASPTTSLNLDMSIGLNSIYNASTFKISTASVVFTQAPEPASLLVLLSGVAGIGAARRLRRGVRANRESAPGAR